MAEWSDFSDAPATETVAVATREVAEEAEARLADAAEALWYIDQELETLKEQRKRRIIEIEELVPEGQEEVRAVDWTLSVKRGERWSWDKDILEEILKQEGHPTEDDYPIFVSKSTTIKRDKFDQQPESVRKKFMPALTRKKGVTTVVVTPDNPSAYRPTD